MTITATSVDLSWSAPTAGADVVAYVVVYRTTGEGAFQFLADGVTDTNYTASGLTPTTSYDFAVYARNGAGPGSLSGVVTVSTLGEVPNSPGSVSASAGSPAYSTVNLSWPAPSTDSTHGPATSYSVSYRANDTGAYTVAQSGITGLSASLASLSSNTLFGIKVDAFNAKGEDVSGAHTTITTDYAPPNVPTITSIRPVYDGTTSKLTVAWSVPSTDGTHDAATGYNIRYSVHGAGSWTTITAVTSGTIITGLTASTSYDVQIEATNASASSPSAWSGSTTASTYSSTVAWGISGPPQSTYVHSSGDLDGSNAAGTNANYSVNPPGVNFAISNSNTVIPTTGLVTISYFGPTYNWAAFLPVPATTGTFYLWSIATDGSGILVSDAFTIT